jgi:hypothetical protein
MVLASGNVPLKTPWLKMEFSRQYDKKTFRISCQSKSEKREYQVVTGTAPDRLAGALRKIFEAHFKFLEASGWEK